VNWPKRPAAEIADTTEMQRSISVVSYALGDTGLRSTSVLSNRVRPKPVGTRLQCALQRVLMAMNRPLRTYYLRLLARPYSINATT
jgi:hypothetical protein